MRFRLTPAIAIAATLLAACADTTRVRQDPQFASRRAAISTVAVLPPNVQFSLRVGDASEKLVEASHRIATELGPLVVTRLEQKGFTPKADAFEEAYASRMEGPRQLAELIEKAYSEVDTKTGVWDLALKDHALNYQRSLGKSAVDLASHAHADALLFTMFHGWTRTTGSIAGEVATKIVLTALLGLLVPPDTSAYSRMLVALVDGRTGDVLWTNWTGKPSFAWAAKDYDSDELSRFVEELFGGFPQ